MTTLETFADRLKFSIEARNMTQTILAEECGIGKSLISVYCSGKRPPTNKTLMKICGILNCTPKWLKYGIGQFEDEFNDYIFDYFKNNPIKGTCKFTIRKGSNDTFEFTSVLTRKEIKSLFDEYLQIF